MGLELNISGNVQSAVNGIKQVESALTSFSSKIKAASVNASALPPAIENTAKALTKVAPASNAANVALINTGRVLQDLPFGIIGVANNINPLVESFQRLKLETGSTKLALSSLAGSLLGGGGLGLAVSAITAALTFATIGFSFFNRGMHETKKATDDSKKSIDEFKQAVDGIVDTQAREITNVSSLIAVLNSETESRQRKLAAIKELNKIAPESFDALKLEGSAVVGLNTAYKTYLDNIKTVIAVKIKQLQLETLIKQQLIEQGGTLTKSEKETKTQIDNLITSLDKITGQTQKARDLKFEATLNAKKLQDDINQILKDIQELSRGVKIDVPDPTRDAEDKTKKFIARAKALFERFPTLGGGKDFIKPIDDLLDTLPQQLSKAAAIINEFNERIKRGGRTKLQLFEEIELVVENAQIVKPINDLKQKLAGPEFKNKIPTVKVQLIPEVPIEKTTKQIEAAAKALTSLLTPAFEELFSAIEKGTDPIKAFFSSLIQSVERLIGKLIAAAAVAAILAALFPGGVGGAKGFGAIFGKIFGFANGGLVSGATLAVVGERSSASNPEVIAPLDQLRGMLGGAGGNIVVTVDGVIRGNDLALLAARTSRSQTRTMGRG